MHSEARDRVKITLLAVALVGLVVGRGLTIAGQDELVRMLQAAAMLPVLAALVMEIVRSLSNGEVGLDIAALPMSAALLFGARASGYLRSAPAWSRWRSGAATIRSGPWWRRAY